MFLIKKLLKKKWVKVTACILSAIVLLCAVGATWNAIASAAEIEEYRPDGQMVDVFDTKMHIFSSGERKNNQPAVVFIAGLATPSPVADFYPLWSRLDDEYYSVVIERPGYGWSESTERERTLNNIVEEDHQALSQAGIQPPYILMAHSIGGLEANLFAADYPDEVQGVVLLDCTSPETMAAQTGSDSLSLLDRLIPAARATGLLRLINAISPDFLANQTAGMRNDFAMLDDYHMTLDRVFVMNKYQNPMMLDEKQHRIENARIAALKPFPSEIPVTLIVAVQPGDEDYPGYQEYMQTQGEWVATSETGSVLTITGRHYIHHFAQYEVCGVIVSMMP